MNVTHKKLLLSIVSLLFCLIVAPVYADDITLRVVQETSDALDIEISILNYSFIKSPYQGYKKIVISGCSLIKKSGAPGTLLRGQLLEIPEDKTVQISYQTIEKITLSNVLLAPVPHRIIEKDDTRSEKVIEEYRIDTAIYSTDNFYPGTIAAVDFTGYLRDKPIANILVYPVQYNPVSKKLELHKKIKIHVSFTDVIFKNTKTALNSFISRVTPEIKNNNPFNSIYRSTLLNFKEDGESEANY